MHIGILGAGTWGVAVARMLADSGHYVTVWSALPQEIVTLTQTRRHPNLPGMIVPDSIAFTDDLQSTCAKKDLLVFAVPSVFVRKTAEKAAPYIPDGQIIADLAKGIEPNTLFSLTEVILDVLNKGGAHDHVKLVALSGPTHAEEVAQQLPTTIVSASEDRTAAEFVQGVFTNELMRVYTSTDIKGVEVSGALKNIVALAAGISAGLGYGANLKAAIITRGLAEITRLGLAMGCAEQTFYGLAGIGDIIVTATSEHSRNNRAGMLIGQGYSAKEACEKVGMVVEGINALPAAMRLAEQYQVDLPITFAVNSVVSGEKTPEEAVRELMTRTQGQEFPLAKNYE
ncbi:MAG: glycerol-3-phosphate dehydrogenase [Firmicutes bacterium HGW-Firmicutes-9]|jgi:glycerol-3-phosphate dehydrogenase (NAD(P)+)|nr:MAG: glycerol-3-phosphate dehydrogenase [Firmicutes bacterium HGW-Firmicutes-9]